MENAILEAIKGGYDERNTLSPTITVNDSQEKFIGEIMSKMYRRETIYPRLLIDPKFWQALGVSQNWLLIDEENQFGEYLDECEWITHAHECLNWLLHNDKLDEFFNNLLKK